MPAMSQSIVNTVQQVNISLKITFSLFEGVCSRSWSMKTMS